MSFYFKWIICYKNPEIGSFKHKMDTNVELTNTSHMGQISHPQHTNVSAGKKKILDPSGGVQ